MRQVPKEDTIKSRSWFIFEVYIVTSINVLSPSSEIKISENCCKKQAITVY